MQVPDSVTAPAHVVFFVLFFLKADDLRGTHVFVHTSPLAAVVFVLLWRPLNSCGMIKR